MKFQDKLKKNSRESIWQEYCGFLDLSMDEYMYIQRRLMDEQLRLWRDSSLGQRLLRGQRPADLDQLRQQLPLTSYADYADVLLQKRKDALPAEPIVWIETTWEGGLRPTKVAPYTRAMLDSYRHNVVAVTILAASRSKGEVNVRKGDRVLYGGAPLPYVTGLLPSLLEEDIQFRWLPDTNANSSLSFSQRIKKGFSMALSGGVDYFFAIGSVANYITQNFSHSTGGGHRGNISLSIAVRFLRAKYLSRRDGRPVRPGDVFRLKGFVCTGTDAKHYRTRLTQAWGVVPIELAAGTESACVGVETWEHNGMMFFPDACFYEFIPEAEMLRSLAQPDYQPRTCLMDQVQTGESYELVISVLHGGAFMRYRIGDVYHCLSAGKGLPPRFTYVDRTPSVIDIAGFTRITQRSVEEILRLSKLGVADWLMKKEFDQGENPYLHMYLEFTPEAQEHDVLQKQLLTEHLTAYFKYFDSDYNDLKKLLDMEPLQLTLLPFGSIAAYERQLGHTLPKINPNALDVDELLRFSGLSRASSGEGAHCL